VQVLARSAWAIGALDLQRAVTGEAKTEGGKRMNDETCRGQCKARLEALSDNVQT
jgi:hypothetical protein